MRTLLLLLLAAAPVRWTCRELRPEGPALGAAARDAFTVRPSGAAYLRPGALPVPPLLPFALRYDFDLVVVSDHPDWDMHELAWIATPASIAPDGVWLAKDADAATREQGIVGSLPDDLLQRLAPELAVDRRGGLVARGVPERGALDLELDYVNRRGQSVSLRYRGPGAARGQDARNGNTLGHSRSLGPVVLDVERRAFGGRVDLSIDGVPRRLRTFAGYPVRARLVQTQAGLLTGGYTAVVDDGVALTLAGGAVLPFARDRDSLVAEGPLRRLTARLLQVEGGWEIERFEVDQVCRDDVGTDEARARCVAGRRRTLDAVFEPALPDLGRPFDGEVTGRFALDVNGQRGQGWGTWVARWDGEAAVLSICPQAPAWIADRPLRAERRGNVTEIRAAPCP